MSEIKEFQLEVFDLRTAKAKSVDEVVATVQKVLEMTLKKEFDFDVFMSKEENKQILNDNRIAIVDEIILNQSKMDLVTKFLDKNPNTHILNKCFSSQIDESYLDDKTETK